MGKHAKISDAILPSVGNRRRNCDVAYQSSTRYLQALYFCSTRNFRPTDSWYPIPVNSFRDIPYSRRSLWSRAIANRLQSLRPSGKVSQLIGIREEYPPGEEMSSTLSAPNESMSYQQIAQTSISIWRHASFHPKEGQNTNFPIKFLELR
ncbi:hypothetical protein CEXT_718931 [Caerostris extrusa]|uniref:Uncharacterized protein n=1 Tax=Caerostris extrusa TaxID=172846 RepID=A0AAV4V3K7_CAEEX|nr:hypothetical protein CEXT_718931 [Caerostris extrusa]